jgi:hypothetical protein
VLPHFERLMHALEHVSAAQPSANADRRHDTAMTATARVTRVETATDNVCDALYSA